MMTANPQTQSQAQAQVKGMADLLILQQRLRQMPNIPELEALLVNGTRVLFPYRTALFWRPERGVVAVSGLPEPVKDAPFTRWIAHLCEQESRVDSSEARELSASTTAIESSGTEWAEYLPEYALWVPVTTPDKILLGSMLLAREQNWKPEEQRILSHWAGAAGHAMQALQLKQRTWWQGLARHPRKRLFIGGGVLVAVVLMLPIRMSILAPAEVVPFDPVVVRAPQDGVIGEVLVSTNENVVQGQSLLKLDPTALQTRLDVASQELEVAKAEYLRAEQASIMNRDAAAQMYMLKSRIEQREAETGYVLELLERVDIKADIDGVAMIDDITELKGRPVALGERILTIADTAKVELEAWVPVDDSLPLAAGASINFYLNVAPGNPVAAELHRIDYQARVSPEGVLAFRARAVFAAGDVPRIGLRGSARIYGERVPLVYYLLRKPLAALRQFVGI